MSKPNNRPVKNNAQPAPQPKPPANANGGAGTGPIPDTSTTADRVNAWILNRLGRR